jgi:hypothetical protein
MTSLAGFSATTDLKMICHWYTNYEVSQIRVSILKLLWKKGYTAGLTDTARKLTSLKTISQYQNLDPLSPKTSALVMLISLTHY